MPSPDRPLDKAVGTVAYLRQLACYIGPGFMVTVGFIDPGNWATNMAGGADFNYSLLWVITLSTLMLILLQDMVAILGIVTGKSLAFNIAERFPLPVRLICQASIYIACVATALAEYLGGAIGLRMLFGLPLWAGTIVTFGFVLVVTILQRYRALEKMILAFLGIIALCYVVELFLARPDWGSAIWPMVVPSVSSESILVAMGMLGAVVMSHNIYLHSSTIQSRPWPREAAALRRRLGFERIDTLLAMTLGWVVNSSMILVAAAVFHPNAVKIVSLEQAAETLRPLLGEFAGLVFGIALLLCGVGSSVTASLAGGHIMAGYHRQAGRPTDTWFRAGVILLTLPALALIVVSRDSFGTLILSQVVLSVMLPFTMVPVVILTSDRRLMGAFANGPARKALAWLTVAIITLLNVLLIYRTFGGTF
jgi:manganese transport protein